MKLNECESNPYVASLAIKRSCLTLSYIMLLHGQTYFKNLAAFAPQDF